MPVTLAVNEHLDDRFDAPLHRNEDAGNDQSRSERKEVALERRLLLDRVRKNEIDCGERHHAEHEGDGVREDLFDDDFDVPQLVFQDRDRERERNQRKWQNRNRRVDRLHRPNDQIRDDVDEQERQEPQRHAEVDPFDLLLADGRRSAIRVRQRHHREREVDREMHDLPLLNQLERVIRRGDGHAIVENQQIDVPKREERRREVQRGNQPFVPDDRTGEQQKEIERQRRKENRRDFFDDLKELVAEVDVAGRRVHVHDEREQRDEIEQRALPPLPSKQSEEANRQIEESDEAEDQVRVVDLQFGHAVRQLQCLMSALHDHRHRRADSAKGLLQPLDFVARRVADDPDLVARPQSRSLGVAVRIDALDDDHAVTARERKIDSLERGPLPLE